MLTIIANHVRSKCRILSHCWPKCRILSHCRSCVGGSYVYGPWLETMDVNIIMSHAQIEMLYRYVNILMLHDIPSYTSVGKEIPSCTSVRECIQCITIYSACMYHHTRPYMHTIIHVRWSCKCISSYNSVGKCIPCYMYMPVGKCVNVRKRLQQKERYVI